MPPSDMESSSGLIMNVIRILTNSKDDEERDVIKKKLEDYLVVSDQKLTKLVAEHHTELRLVMEAFTSIAKNLQASLTRLSKAKQRLIASRELLTSKLEELKKLSEESKRNEKILALLDQSEEQLKAGPVEEPAEDRESSPDLADTEAYTNEKNKTLQSNDSYLFKFSRSSYGICFTEYYKEQGDNKKVPQM